MICSRLKKEDRLSLLTCLRIVTTFCFLLITAGSLHEAWALQDTVVQAAEQTSYSCGADLDADLDVDGRDLQILLPDLGRQDCCSLLPCAGDFNADQMVDVRDLEVLASQFGQYSCPLTYEVEGYVIGINIHQPGPLGGIRVAAGDRETLTDANGRFSLDGLPSSEFQLQVDGWQASPGPYAQVHYDIAIPSGETGLQNYVVRLPYIGPAGRTSVDDKIAAVTIDGDGRTVAVLRTDLYLDFARDDRQARLKFARGTEIVFPAGVEPALALTHLGLAESPVALPMEPVSGERFFTANIFTIQPENVIFSPPPVFVFDDHDGLPAGTSYLSYHYGSWADNTPPQKPTKQEDGSIAVPTGITSSGTVAFPANPLEYLPSDWEKTTLTGRVVRWDRQSQSWVPVPGAEVTGGINGGITGADGRFSFQVPAQIPGTDMDLMVFAFTAVVVDGEPLVGRKTELESNPGGITDLGDIELNTLMRLIEVVPAPLDSQVDPAYLTDTAYAQGIKYHFDRPLDTLRSADAAFYVMRYPMRESLYDQHLLSIPADWGDFDAAAYTCDLTGHDPVFFCEPPGCEEVDDACVMACYGDCETALAGCLSACQPGCADQCGSDPVCYEHCYGSCIAACRDTHVDCYLDCSACDGDCVECDLPNTAVFNLAECLAGQADAGLAGFFNQWWFPFVAELDAGFIGKNDEIVFYPDLTRDVATGLSGGKEITTALVNYMGYAPLMLTNFATREESAIEPSPRFGLLVPDQDEPGGYRWHDAESLDPSSTIEVEPGSVLRLQAEDQTFMRRITARLDDADFVQLEMAAVESPFLMHLEIPFPADAGTAPLLLQASAEGVARESLLAVNGIEGHMTEFSVYLQAASSGPTISAVVPQTDIPLCTPVPLQITGSGLATVEELQIIEPGGESVAVPFTIEGDTQITSDPFIFATGGEHRVVVSSPAGEANALIMTADEWPAPHWGVGAQSTYHSYYEEPVGVPHESWDGDESPEPYCGVSPVHALAEIGTDANMAAGDAELPTGSGAIRKGSTIDILHVEQQIKTSCPDLPLAWVQGTVRNPYQEVITLLGTELPDGSRQLDGTLSCHLEIQGTAYQNDWFGYLTYATYSTSFTVGLLSPGSDLNDTFCSGEAYPGPYPAEVELLGEVALQMDTIPPYPPGSAPPSWPVGNSEISLSSPVFELPASGTILFRPSYAQQFVGNNYSRGIAKEGWVNLDFRLVCEDPEDRILVYRK